MDEQNTGNETGVKLTIMANKKLPLRGAGKMYPGCTPSLQRPTTRIAITHIRGVLIT